MSTSFHDACRFKVFACLLLTLIAEDWQEGNQARSSPWTSHASNILVDLTAPTYFCGLIPDDARSNQYSKNPAPNF
jgi:hypothetical protein